MFKILFFLYRPFLIALILAVLMNTSALPANAAGARILQHPYDPPEKEETLRIPRAPWRESLPALTDVLVPDLQTLPPFDLQLIVNQFTGSRRIRFANSVWNRGEGVMELRGVLDEESRKIIVSQDLYGPDSEVIERRVSSFHFNPVHGHWHWEDFGHYEIWSTGPWGELVEVVARSDKVGFCMLDTSPITREWLDFLSITDFQVAERARYGECGWRLQGISVGWMDTYDADVPGQEIDVSTLPDGLYALRSTVDPQGLLFESDKENNSAMVYFQLEGDQLQVIDGDLQKRILRRCRVPSEDCDKARQY